MGEELPRVTIYSDGACEGNPGPGGWAALLKYGMTEKLVSGGETDTTNNRMELQAAIQSLQALKKPCQIDFYTDSQYLRKGITEWLSGWKARSWKRKEGELKNVDLWQALDRAVSLHKIAWHWTRGHAGNSGNERVDQAARAAAALERDRLKTKN
jgi:ribonuclease HI